MVEYQRDARSKPDARNELQFVLVEPGHESKEEKNRTRSVIRANAAHFHWRHNRPPGWQDESQRPLLRRKRAEKKSTKSKTASATKSPAPQKARRQASVYGQQLHLNHASQQDIYHCEAVLQDMTPWREYALGSLASFASDLPPDYVTRCIAFSQYNVIC